MAIQTRPKIHAEPRMRVRKKSALRELRSQGEVPALLYGNGDPRPIKISGRDLRDFMRQHPLSGILEVELSDETTPAIIRELDRDPISGEVLHLGFQRVSLDESIRTTIPIRYAGESVLVDNQLVLQPQMDEVEVMGRVDAIPDHITVDVSDLEGGTSIRIADLPLPDGVTSTRDPELPVASITASTVSAEAAADEAEAEAAAAEEEAA